MKKASNVRLPQNIKSWIFQQPLIGSYSNLNLNLHDQPQIKKLLEKEVDLQWKTTSNEIRHYKFKFHWLDLSQILNLSWNWMIDVMKTSFNGRPPQINKSRISQQPLIRSSSNFKLKLRRPGQHWILLEIKTISKISNQT